MKFADVGILNIGYLGIPRLSCVYNASTGIVWRAQNPCVLRLKYGNNTTTDYAVVTTTISGNSVQVTVAMNVGWTMYVPLNETFLSLFDRVKNNSLTLSGVTGTLVVEEYDSTGTLLNTLSYNITVCDSGGVPPVDVYQSYAHVLPDTFLFPSPAQFKRHCFLTARFIGGVDELDIRNALGVSISNYTRTAADTVSASRYVLGMTAPATMVALSSGGEQETARIVFQPMCDGQQVFLMWWSPVDGGWKSRIADAMGLADSIARTLDYRKLYTDLLGKSASGGLSCRFPSLSERDYAYYRDILMSDEVYLVTPVDDYLLSGDVNAVPVRIEGDFPANVRNRSKDVDFNVIFNDYTEI